MTRRAVVTAMLCLPLAGCRVRWESDAPGILPPPSPDPAGPALVEERQVVSGLVAALPTSGLPLAAELTRVHTVALAALDAALAALDPPLRVPSPAPTTPPGASASRTSPALTAARAAARGLDAGGQRELDLLLPRVAPIVLASAAHRAVDLAGWRAAGVGGLPGLATAPWTCADATVGAQLLDAVRGSVYALEVAAVRLPADRRGIVTGVVDDLRLAERDLLTALPDAPPLPPAYRVADPLDTPRRVAAFTDRTLTRLSGAAVACAGPTCEALRRSAEAPRGTGAGTGQATATGTASTSSASAGGATTPPRPTASATSNGRGSMASLLRLIVLAETARRDLGGAPRPLPVLEEQARAGRPTASGSPTTP